MKSVINFLEKWDNFGFFFINLYIRLLFVPKYFSYRKYLKRNKSLNNKHNKERCFIVLNGPSLNNYDLSKISEEYVFCVNYMFRSKLVDVIKPNYYCWCDAKNFLSNDPSNIESLFNRCPYSTFFFGKEFAFMQKTEIMNDMCDNVFVTHNSLRPSFGKIKNNISKISSNFNTVALYALNIAIYMGFSEIYLLGYDFPPGSFSHFENLGVQNEDPNKLQSKEQVCGNYMGYVRAMYENYYIKKIAEKKGIKIFNCNSQSNVRSFDFKNFDEVMSKNE